ncbi:MAG TPA: NADH-quinone oxidoreductase subunit C, partial [Ktedonobacter sp.]|nr:NADH-quinone oxidoreductase subunit C [Ktedonobacter sp.]
MAITAIATVEMVRQKFPRAIVETVEFRGEQTIVLKPEDLVTVCRYLQKDLGYNFLSSVTAVDWLERVPRFDVVYHLLSISNQCVLRLKVRVG